VPGLTSRLALEELLVDRGLVARDALDALVPDPTGRQALADRVVAAGLATEEQIAFAISEELGYPFVTPTPSGVDVDLVRRAPSAVLRRHRALPLLLHEEENMVDVAFADPTDARAVEAIGAALGRGVRPAVATSTAVLAALRTVFGADGGHFAHEDDVVETSGALHLHARLVEAVGRGADALQIRPAADGGTLSLRIDGRWEDVDRLTAVSRSAVVARLAALADLPARSAGLRRGALTTRIGGHDVRLCASVVTALDGEVATVAIHDATPLLRGEPPGLTSEEVAALVAFVRGGDGVLAIDDADEDAALTLATRLLSCLPARARVVVAGRAGTPRVEGAVHVEAVDKGGIGAAVEAALACLPDVLVVVPGPGAPPPREALLAAQGGLRVVMTGTGRTPDEVRDAWAAAGLPAPLARSLRFVVATRRDEARRAHITCVRDGEERA